MRWEHHEKLTQWGMYPIAGDRYIGACLLCLKYKNKRTDFVDALFNIIKWDNTAQRLDTALK